MKTKCPKCGYEWDCKSKHRFVSCPSCMAKIKVAPGKDDINLDKRTTLKFVCYGKVLKKYPLVGFDKGEIPEIMEMLSKNCNVPLHSIRTIID
jgi:hypothetical protein